MRPIPTLVVLAVVLAWAAPAEAAPKVAVIDMVQAIQEHPRAKVVEDNFRKAQQDADNSRKKSEQDLEGLKREIEAMEARQPGRDLKVLNYQLRAASAKITYDHARRKAVQQYTKDLEGLYRAVSAIVSQVARERQLELVLDRGDPDRPMNAGSPEDVALKSRLNTVVFAESSLDITQEVIARMKK